MVLSSFHADATPAPILEQMPGEGLTLQHIESGLRVRLNPSDWMLNRDAFKHLNAKHGPFEAALQDITTDAQRKWAFHWSCTIYVLLYHPSFGMLPLVVVSELNFVPRHAFLPMASCAELLQACSSAEGTWILSQTRNNPDDEFLLRRFEDVPESTKVAALEALRLTYSTMRPSEKRETLQE